MNGIEQMRDMSEIQMAAHLVECGEDDCALCEAIMDYAAMFRVPCNG